MTKNKILFLSFFALTFLIYGQSLWGGFVFDDRGIGEHQVLLSSLDNVLQVAVFPYWTVEAGLYRPVTLLSYLFNIVLLGPGAFGFHLVNLLLYFGICASIYVLIRRLSKDEWLAYLTVLFFLVLPIHTEVVANITGRSELLALFFSLLTILEFTSEKRNDIRAGLWFLLAIGAKETAIAALPLALIVAVMREGKLSFSILDQYFKSFAALVLAASAYFFLRFFVLGPEHFLGIKTGLIENPLLFASISGRMATAFQILWMYIEKTFWPVGLCSDYSYNQIPVVEGFLHSGVLLGVAALSLALFAIFFFRQKKPLLSFAAGVFLFSFLPVSNLLLPIGTIAGERLFFFPSLGIAIVAGLLLSKLRWRYVAFSLIAVYALVAFNRQGVWLSEERLFLNAVECSPESALSLSNAGTVYYFRGDYGRAAEYLERSRAIKPIYSKGLNNLGLVYWKQGRSGDAEKLYHDALIKEFPYSGAIENLVLLRLSENDEKGALRWLRIKYPNAGDSFLRNLF